MTHTLVFHEGGPEIHKAGCKDLKRWAGRTPFFHYDDPTLVEITWDVYGDQIGEETMTLEEGVNYLKKVAVKPCVKGLKEGEV